MRVTEHLRLRKYFDQGDLRTFERLEKEAGKWISSDAVAEAFVGEILQLFHAAFSANPLVFVKDLFFPNQLTLRATYARQDFILSQFKKAKKIVNLENRQMALENIYRSVVSDLFDPYLSVLVASVQLAECSFRSFELANLGKGEFNKYEFLKKRLKPDGLLKGYFPVIRNSISHAGSHGVIRDGDEITFRGVKRGGQPGIGETKAVTTAELTGYIQDLIDLVAAIETSINIMGLDLKDTIIRTPELARAFQSLATQKQLAQRRLRSDKFYKKIWHNEKMTSEARREYFTRLFAQGCQQNEMPATYIRFQQSFVVIQIPRRPIVADDQALINRVTELVNYLLLAELLFHFEYSDYLVEELPEEGQPSLQLWLKAEELKAYSLGEAHILDLMHDGKLFRDRQHQPILVNFEQLDEDDSRSLRFASIRKKR